MFFEGAKMNPQEEAEMEVRNAQAYQNRADIEFIALMTDVELDDGDDEMEGGNNVEEEA